MVERSFAHCYETGGMRRCHLRGHENILKRQLIHVGAFNLSLILRTLIGGRNAGGVEELRPDTFCVLTRPVHASKPAPSVREHEPSRSQRRTRSADSGAARRFRVPGPGGIALRAVRGRDKLPDPREIPVDFAGGYTLPCFHKSARSGRFVIMVDLNGIRTQRGDRTIYVRGHAP